jgi:hypothetical protein
MQEAELTIITGMTMESEAALQAGEESRQKAESRK